MELNRIRNDSESRIVFELVMIKPVYIVARIVQKRPFRLAAETNRLAACAPQNGKKFGIFVDENSE